MKNTIFALTLIGMTSLGKVNAQEVVSYLNIKRNSTSSISAHLGYTDSNWTGTMFWNKIGDVRIRSINSEFHFDSDGSLGIGTNNPSEKLEIGGDSKLNLKIGRWATIGTTGGGLATIIGNNVKASQNTNNKMEFITTTNDGAKAIKMQYNEGITFHTMLGSVTSNSQFAGYERMRIDNNGNIGIGVKTPNSKLHFRNGDGNATFIIQGKQDSNTGNFAELILSTEYSSATTISGTQTGRKTLIRSTAGSAWGGNPRLGFFTSNNMSSYPQERMTISPNGNIGVDTIVPDMKLTVNGNIHAKEVKIDLNIPAPDYVFKKNYNLRSINDLENFIKENSHLPEIPSAKEFEQNGVMQAEMDMNLLKKIEELTLYTIQQQKEIEELKLQNKKLMELQKRLEKLENK